MTYAARRAHGCANRAASRGPCAERLLLAVLVIAAPARRRRPLDRCCCRTRRATTGSSPTRPPRIRRQRPAAAASERGEEAGIDYMRTGSPMSLAEFRRIAAGIDRELADTDRYDERAEVIAFVRSGTRGSLPRSTSPSDGRHAGPQDTFEGHMQHAAHGLEHLMAGSQDEVTSELAASEAGRAAELAARPVGRGGRAAAGGVLAHAAEQEPGPPARAARAGRPVAGRRGTWATACDRLPSRAEEVGTTFNTMAEALEEQRDELERHAFADSLTGLANRALFEDRTAARPRAGRGRGRAAWRCSCSTWTASSSSTTASATPAATPCSSRPPRA